MSQKASNLFWELADTKLVAQILKAKDPKIAQQLAIKLGYDVAVGELEKNSPKTLLLGNPRNRMGVQSSQSSSSQSSSSQSSSSQSSSSQSSPGILPSKKRDLESGCERRLTFNYRPIV